MSNAPKKPQAFSHMLWFFLIPCLGFLIWASSRWITEIYIKPQKKEVLTLNLQIEKIEKAKNPGDRWQAAYALSHFVQKSLADKSWLQIPEQTKSDFFTRLGQLLTQNTGDHRLVKYAVLMLGQIRDPRGLPLLFEESQKNTSTEINFFSGWSIIEILSSNENKNLIPSADLAKYQTQISTWIKDTDPALRKIAGVYLIQFGSTDSKNTALTLLNDENIEVRWNTIIALATIKDPRAEKLLAEMFDIAKLRSVEFKSAKDIYQTLRSAYLASLKLDSELVKQAIEKLKSSVRPSTPEGDAVLAAFADSQQTSMQAR